MAETRGMPIPFSPKMSVMRSDSQPFGDKHTQES